MQILLTEEDVPLFEQRIQETMVKRFEVEVAVSAFKASSTPLEEELAIKILRHAFLGRDG